MTPRGTSPEHATAQPQDGDYGAPRVIVPAPRDERYAHLSWPKIVKAKDGALVVAYIAGREHCNGDGCPAVSTSRDGGETFSAPNVLMTFDKTKTYHHAANLALGLADDGTIVLLAMAFTDDERNSIFGWRSEDSGDSWRRIDASRLGDNKTGSVFGHVFAVPGRGLAACGHYRKPKGDGVWIAFSTDHGRTWGEPEAIIDRRLFEPAFICVDGRLIGLIRENGAHAYHQYVSSDLGKTWQSHDLVLQGDGAAVHPSPFIVSDPARPSVVHALQSQRTSRGEVYLWSADAVSLDWRRRGLVVSFAGCEDYSYPWMAHIEDDEWFAVFYAGRRRGPNSIYGLRLTAG